MHSYPFTENCIKWMKWLGDFTPVDRHVIGNRDERLSAKDLRQLVSACEEMALCLESTLVNAQQCETALKWQPIETAPKNRQILARGSDGAVVVSWDEGFANDGSWRDSQLYIWHDLKEWIDIPD